jgi:hypothetical protein
MRPRWMIVILLCLGFGACSLHPEKYNWRLSRPEATRVAEHCAIAHGFRLADYPQRRVQQFTDTRPEWYVNFAPPYPQSADSDFLVVVDDTTGKAHLVQGH